MARSFRSAEMPTSWCGPRTRHGALAGEPALHRVDFLRRGFLLGQQVIEAEDEQRVGVVEDALVERQPVARLIDPLEHRDDVVGDFAHELLEGHPRPEEQLQRAGDALLEQHRVGPLRPFPERPLDPPHLGHRREPVVQVGHVAIGLAGEAPAHVDADPPPPAACSGGGGGAGCRCAPARACRSSGRRSWLRPWSLLNATPAPRAPARNRRALMPGRKK